MNTVLRSFLRTPFLKNICQRLPLSPPSDLAALRPIRKRGDKVFKVLVLCFFKAFPINFQLIRLFNFFHCWNRFFRNQSYDMRTLHEKSGSEFFKNKVFTNNINCYQVSKMLQWNITVMTQESALSYLQFTAMSAFTIFPLISNSSGFFWGGRLSTSGIPVVISSTYDNYSRNYDWRSH